MKIKTSELTGAALDWAAAIIFNPGHEWGEWKPSTDWAQGGVIIERERIDLSAYSNHWEARLWAGWEDNQKNNPPHIAAAKHRIGRVTQSVVKHGETPLIAAMRCYVASKLGDEVKIPDELKGTV